MTELHMMASAGPLRDVQALAANAQASGLDGMVFTETSRTAYLSVAAATLAAPELSYATGVAVAFPRSPMVTAGAAWELQQASNGRFRLGLGTQVKAHVERRYGTDFDPPGPRMKEYIKAVKACFRGFRGEKLDFHSDYHDLTLLPAMWSPGAIDAPDPAVDVAAVGPWMVKMAGEVADGVHVHPFHSVEYFEQNLLPGLAEGAAVAGRAVDDLRLLVPVFTIVGDTEEEKARWREAVRFQIGFYGSTKNYTFMFDMLGFDGTSARLNEKLKAGDMGGMAAQITDEMLEHFAVECGWDDLADRLSTRYAGKAHTLILYFAEAMERAQPGSLAKFGEVAKAIH